MSLPDLLAVARGDTPASLALRRARLVDVWAGEIVETDIILQGAQIAALGRGYAADHEIDLQGRYVCPGLIDAHVHIESSLCAPPEFARAVVPHGVTTVVTDPHEIANVLGIDGIRYMLERAQNGPLNMYVMVPSCVPATHMETSGARLEAEDLAALIDHPWALGLAEVMNYPGVIHADEGMLDKLELFHGRVIDGHCPAVTGKALNAYVSAGIGSDHESTQLEEAREKLRLGLTLFLREGTTTRNLAALLPLVTPLNHTRMCFCTDDRQPNTLMDEGSIDDLVRKAIAYGIDPIMAIRMGSLNTAQYFRLHHLGVIAPGRQADLVVFSDLHDFQAQMVFCAGTLVAQDGKMIAPKPSQRTVPLRPSLNIDLSRLDFRIPAAGTQVRAIAAVGDQVVTGNQIVQVRVVDGEATADVQHDLLKIVVVERHQGTGNIGKGFITGFGIRRGALAGTVAHDHHNLIIIGADDASMRRAAEEVAAMGGGLVLVDGETVMRLPLSIAGLMTEEPLVDVRRQYDALNDAARRLGSTFPDAFMLMSFMGLEVIPSLKLTDLGLVDVEQFALVDLFA
jgi:adenine deaminase